MFGTFPNLLEPLRLGMNFYRAVRRAGRIGCSMLLWLKMIWLAPRHALHPVTRICFATGLAVWLFASSVQGQINARPQVKPAPGADEPGKPHERLVVPLPPVDGPLNRGLQQDSNAE